MSRPTIEPTRTEPPRRTDGRAQPWERDGAAHQLVRERVHDLPSGFVVFDALQLPRPTRAVVDHLVVGPRNVWAVTTHVSADPVTVGLGRNADTLWSGNTSLRTVLEAADWESAALAEHIGVVVEPVVCIVAPELPESSFDFHGIRISEPSSIARQVATSTADYVDVAAVVAAVRRSFGVEPATGTAPPKLGVAVQPPMLRPGRAGRRRRTFGARLHSFKSMRPVRVGVAIALAAVLVTSLPTILGAWNSVASEGADRITAAVDDVAIADGSSDPDSNVDRAGVGYVLTCPDPGGGWLVEWSWPEAPQPGVAGYSVRTRTGGAATVVHTTKPWTDPASAPPVARLSNPAVTEVITEHRAPDGTIVATTSETMSTPATAC